jgi:DNA-binding MarR family transcriptional regulator
VIGGGDNPATKSLGDRVLAFLQKSPYNRYEQEEISQALGIPLSNKDSIYQALARLFKRGLITKRPSKNGGKRKVYGVANPSQLAHTEGLRSATVTQTDKEQDTHTPLPLKVSVKNAEIVTSKDVELTDTLTDNLTDTKLTPRNGVSLDNSSNAQLESDSAKLTNTDSQGCVCPESATVTQETVTGAVKAVGSHASVSEEMETAPWKAGDKFRYTGTRSAEMTKKYAGKILVVKSYTSARGGSIEAEGAKDGFPVWTVERVVN